jgi:hypothetical protein
MQAERRERAKLGKSTMPSTSSETYQGFGNSGGNDDSSYESSINTSSSSSSRSSSSSSTSSRKPKTGGMAIGAKKKNKKSKFLSGMSTSSSSTSTTAAVVDEGTPAAPLASTHVQVHEDLTITMKQDMTVDSMTVKGFLAVTCRDEDKRIIDVQCNTESIANGTNNDFTYKCNPKMDGTEFKNSGLLCLKNKTRPYPLNKAVKILQWRMSTTDETKVPLTFNCWPESQGDGTWCDPKGE